MKNFNYDFVLPFFTDVNDFRPEFKNVHRGDDGFIYASNSYLAIKVSVDFVKGNYLKIEKYPPVDKLFHIDNDFTHSISVDDLISILTHAKWERALEKCSACDGDGEIECECCGTEIECECCGGKGLDGELDFGLLTAQEKLIIKINGQNFSADCIHIIAVAAKVIGVETVQFYGNTDSYRGFFKIGEMEIVLVGIPPSGEDFQELKLCTKKNNQL